MHVSLDVKLAAVVALLGLVGAGISAFALRRAAREQTWAALTESFGNAGWQAPGLARAIEHTFIQAGALCTVPDTKEAKQHLSARQSALGVVERRLHRAMTATGRCDQEDVVGERASRACPVGQMSSSTQRPQAGERWKHTCCPCSISTS